jgi:hypothetical protein
MQLRVESRRFEVAQVQLQVQLAKTDTAKAQLAVEKARNRGRQLDIEMEQHKTAAAAAKSAADSARDASRLLDLDKQTAIAQVKKEAAQLHLQAQQERGATDLDLTYQQRETARAFMGLEQARLRNEQTEAARAEADSALIELGVLQSRPSPTWQCAFDCGFCTTDPTELQEHQKQCSTDEDGFSRSWDTGRWRCDYCEFEIEHADFTQAASDKHQSDCLYRKRDGSPFMCNTCEQPTSVPAERLASLRISPWNHDRIKCQDCQEPPELTADASVQTDLPVHGKKQKKGKAPGQ